MHRISTAGVAQKEGKLFIALRKPGTSVGEKWEFPGGKVKSGESPRDALKREFREEFNVVIDVGDQICTGEFTNKGITYRLLAFFVSIHGTPESVEHQKYRWVSPEEIRHHDFPGSDRIILKALDLVSDQET